jgi:O-antigen/teichoic acid export membrane protein
MKHSRNAHVTRYSTARQPETPLAQTHIEAANDAHSRQQSGNRLLLLGRAFFFLSAYVVSAVLARNLSATDYGIYGVIMSQLLWLEIVVNGGIPVATSKRMTAAPRQSADDVEPSAVALLLCCSAVAFAASWFAAPALAHLMHISKGALLFRVAALDVPFGATLACYDGILSGRRRFGLLAAAQVVYGLTKVGGLIVLVVFGFSVQRIFVLHAVATCFACATVALHYRLRGRIPSISMMRQIAVLGASMAIYLVFGQVLVNLDLWSLKALWHGSGDVVGQYVASVNLSRTLVVIPTAQAGVLFASMAWAVASSDEARARRHLLEATRFVLVIATAACVILGIDASEILSLLFSHPYAAGEPFARCLLVGFGLYALVDAFSHSLMASGQQWRVAGALVATLPIAVSCNLFLIPRFGAIGAATSMLIGMLTAGALTGWMAYRRFGLPVRATTAVRVAMSAAVVAAVSLSVPAAGYVLLIKIGFLAALYLVLLFLLGEITPSDFGISAVNRRKPVRLVRA